MKAKNLFRLTAMMLIGVATMCMTSCKKEEPVPSKNAWILGKWYMEKPKSDTIQSRDGNKVVCSKVVLAGWFEANGWGFWSLIYVDDENRAIMPVEEGKINPYFANCTYSVSDKTVQVKLTANYLPTSQIDWTLTYDGDCLKTKFENEIVDLHPITTGEDAMFLEWMRQLGFGASAENYNINDEDFTPTNWRDEEAIYIYDGKGTDVTDAKGRTGYTLVALPWYKGGVVDSNLDPEFCDDITPENGWEWVLNLCGERSIVNNNFFAVYNKYSGILRFFYYMPNKVASGNDHMWEIDMTNMMAQSSVFRFGLPLDLNIVNKAAMGQDKENLFVDYITPYVRQIAPDGTITPNQGWWAFDIDMSLYRPNDNSFGDNQSISLQIRSWDVSHVSLTSAITGKLDGQMQLDQTKTTTTVSQKKGLFGFIKDGIKIGKTAAAAIASAKTGDVKGALKNGISAAKDGYAFYGALKNNKTTSTTTTDTLSRITGTFNASVQADAETDGIIRTSKPVTGAASPTIPGKKFITAGSNLGKGVWNLKTSPVVYYFNSAMGYKRYILTFFDPSSVEVVLNPDVFPESDIEWVEVDAIAGVRKGGTGTYREAFGIPDPKFIDGSWYMPNDIYGDKYFWGFDFFYNSDDKYGMKYVHNQQNGNHLISGMCLDGEYFLEPGTSEEFPDIEVDVTVVLKLQSMDAPMVYSRSYVAAKKSVDIKNLKGIADTYNRIVNTPKQNGKFVRGPIYDYQLRRIYSFRRYVDQKFDFKAVKTKGANCINIGPALRNYYDNNGVDDLVKEFSNKGKWALEWSYDKPAAPWAYEMSATHTDNTSEAPPVSWKLFAKLNPEDEWTLLDEQKDNTKWYGSQWYTPRTAQFNIKKKNQPWQYYRMEVTKKGDKNYRFNLPTFKFLY